jgi:predicted O-methyltransferase YrrM
MYFIIFFKLLFRVLRQKPYKTLRTIASKERLLATIWLEANKVSMNSLIDLIGKDKNLINESKNFEKKFLIEIKDKIKNLPISGGIKGSTGGGGGNIFILYYIIRSFNPDVVIESGVSAGSSSSSIIQALEKNKKGNLYSSDLNSHLEKKDVGIMVPSELKHRWKLFDEGDKINLPKILDEVENVDVVYYDSEKSYEGKKNFIEKILIKHKPKIIVIDDIDRDYWFRDFINGDIGNYKYLVVKNVGYLIK